MGILSSIPERCAKYSYEVLVFYLVILVSKNKCFWGGISNNFQLPDRSSFSSIIQRSSFPTFLWRIWIPFFNHRCQMSRDSAHILPDQEAASLPFFLARCCNEYFRYRCLFQLCLVEQHGIFLLPEFIADMVDGCPTLRPRHRNGLSSRTSAHVVRICCE